MLKKKDALVIGAVLVIALAMLAVSRLLPKTNLEEKVAQVTMAPDAVEYLDATAEPTTAPTEAPAAAQTEAPAEPTQAPAEAMTAELAKEPEQSAAVGPMLPQQTQKIGGHVVLTVGNRQYGDPIPMDRDKIITIRQSNGQINKVHITPDSVYMEYSTCDNQDCVGQGHITLDNYETRILSTFVICLPNNVTIEMIPAEE